MQVVAVTILRDAWLCMFATNAWFAVVLFVIFSLSYFNTYTLLLFMLTVVSA